MPKLAIYVPKRDMREIDKWRKKINFSQIFMQALMREIEERSRVVSGSDEKVSRAARHYRSKLEDGHQHLSDFGFRLGSDAVLNCRLSPEIILRLQQVGDVDCPTESDHEAIEQALRGCREQIDEFAQRHKIKDETHPLWRAAITSSYLKGVGAAWKRVCAQMRQSESSIK